MEFSIQHYDVPFQPLGYCRSWFDRTLFVVDVVWKFSSEIYLQSAVEELKQHSFDLSSVFWRNIIDLCFLCCISDGGH